MDPPHREAPASRASPTATPSALPTNGKHREQQKQGIQSPANGTPQQGSTNRTDEERGSTAPRRVEPLRTALTNRLVAAGASAPPDPPDERLNRRWQMTLLQLQMYPPAGIDLSNLRYVELREVDAVRGWVLLTVLNASLQAQLQQGPLKGYIRETLSWLCQRTINVAVVITTREGLPTLDMVLTQEGVRSAVRATVTEHQGDRTDPGRAGRSAAWCLAARGQQPAKLRRRRRYSPARRLHSNPCPFR